MTEVDPYSRSTIPIAQCVRDVRLGDATGFVWFEHGVHYLITNWHVVAMVDPNTGANLHTKAARPERFKLQLNSSRYDFGKIPHEVRLLDDAGMPLWFVHPIHKRKVDVVAIPLDTAPEGSDYCPINRLRGDDELAVKVSMDVFVLGYPFGAPPPGFPIWKRGSIASEPDVAPLSTRYMLIDTASRPGMSGAPVVLRTWGLRVTEAGATYTIAGAATRFIGVYSGRLYTKDALEAQIGIVWPPQLLLDIIAGKKRDEEGL
jgi:hypothetical protein